MTVLKGFIQCSVAQDMQHGVRKFSLFSFLRTGFAKQLISVEVQNLHPGFDGWQKGILEDEALY